MPSPAVQALVDRNASNHLNHPSHAFTPKLSTLLDTFAKDTDGREPRICVVTCGDPRCVPERFFDTQPGEISSVRNAGGDVQNAMTSVLAVDSIVKFTDLIVVKHTDCGSLMVRDEKIKEGLYAREGLTEEDKEKVRGYRFGENTIPIEESVKRDLKYLAETPLIRPELKKNLAGFVYNLEDGGVREVVV